MTLYDSYRRHQTHIKVLDDEKLSLVKKIDIENFGTSPVISNTFENNNSLLIWLTLTNIVMPLESAIYELSENNTLKRIGKIPEFNILIDYDGESFYFYSFAYQTKSIRKVILRKYDRNLNAGVPFHFNEDHNIAVVDVLHDKQTIWYSCLKDPVPEHGKFIGKPLLARRRRGEGEVEFFALGNELFFPCRITSDDESLWVFGSMKKQHKNVIFRFSKLKKTFHFSSSPTRLLPIPHRGKTGIFGDTHFLWLYDPEKGAVYRLDTKTFSLQQLKLPGEIIYSVFYSDEEYLWIGGDIPRKQLAYSGRYMPCLVRLSKDELNCTVFVVKPTISESFSTVLQNSTLDLLSPVLPVLRHIMPKP
ncbi:MAG: hypothetical protein P8X90_12095 [Desulfobacterales bacterium]